MSKPENYIIEVKELVKAYGLESFAKIIDFSERGIQYWLADDPKKPGPATQRKIHELFEKHRAGEDLTQVVAPDYKDELIASLKREKELLTRENARLDRDLKLSLTELRHNIILTRALAATNQNLLIEVLAKQRKTPEAAVAADANKLFDAFYKSMKEEGNFAYVGK